MVERVQASSPSFPGGFGISIDVTVVVAKREFDYSTLHLLGELTHIGIVYPIHGVFNIKPDRSVEPAIAVTMLENGTTLHASFAVEVMYMIVNELDQTPDGLMNAEMTRILGDGTEDDEDRRDRLQNIGGAATLLAQEQREKQIWADHFGVQQKEPRDRFTGGG